MPEAHYCEHPGCSAFGCFGVGAVQRLGKPAGKHGLRPIEMVGTMRWYCGEHRQAPETIEPPASSAPAVDAKPKGRDRLL